VAAGYAPTYRETPLDDESMTPVRAALDITLAELSIESFFPADERTAEALRKS
jgi:hypothetical protein